MIAGAVVVAVALAGLSVGSLLARRDTTLSVFAFVGLVASLIAALVGRHWAARTLDRWSLDDSQARAAATWAVFAALALPWLVGLFAGRASRSRRA